MRYPSPKEIWEHLRSLDNDPANQQRYVRFVRRLLRYRSQHHVL